MENVAFRWGKASFSVLFAAELLLQLVDLQREHGLKLIAREGVVVGGHDRGVVSLQELSDVCLLYTSPSPRD